jgi:hypothetical protein
MKRVISVEMTPATAVTKPRESRVARLGKEVGCSSDVEEGAGEALKEDTHKLLRHWP